MYRNDIYTGLEQYVATQVNPKRFAHCQSCAITMKALLERFPYAYGDDPAKSDAGLYVGLWHDVARGWSDSSLSEYCRKHRLPMEPEEDRQPMLLHGAVAAALMEEKLPGCPDAWRLAVRWHSLGDISMGALGLAMYIVDYLEPRRKHLTDKRRRYLLFLPTLEAMAMAIMEDQDAYFRLNGISQAGCTKRLYEYMKTGGRL